MEYDHHRKEIEHIWKVIIEFADECGIKKDKNKYSLACEFLLHLNEIDEDVNPSFFQPGLGNQFSSAYFIWQTISYDLGGWLLRSAFPDGLESKKASSRHTLEAVLDIQSAKDLVPYKDDMDPIPILLPRNLLVELRSALAALNEGEIQQILLPNLDGRHKDAWTWDQMRGQAVEHVAYLNGQGFTKKIARGRVASSMKVPPETLRFWEGMDKFKEYFKNAFKAGELKIFIEDQPDYIRDNVEWIDNEVLSVFKRFRRGRGLVDFGKEYQKKFGYRHNPGDSVDS